MSRLEIVIATRNPKKFRELKTLLVVPGFRWHGLGDFPQVPAVPERGKTFRVNAMTKARRVAIGTGCLAIADDSGLEVEALGGAPGVRSARFAGGHGDDHANNAKLLRMLEGLPAPKRRARFRCVLALASPTGVLAVTEGTLVGDIATCPAGHRGFGYDPIFVVPRFKKTVAQLPTSMKHRISHRAQAAHRMRRELVTIARNRTRQTLTK